jgi:hypothetical protein
MPMPPDPKAAALQSALGGGADAPVEEPGGEAPIDPQELMQLIQMAQQSGDPKVLALLQQLLQLLGPQMGPPAEE